MEHCPICDAVLAVKLLEEMAVADEAGGRARAYCVQLVCPNRACENGRSGRVLRRSMLTPPLPARQI